MPISTPLSQGPYFSSFSEAKNFHRVLFKPGVSVQNRELHELQEILQNQIERFGDNIFQKGTVVSGCNFAFHNKYPYAKIVDTQVDGEVAIPALYAGNFCRNAANLRAYIINYQEGFEATDPDLKTLYFNYINSGTDFVTDNFSAGDLLTIYNGNNTIFKIKINNGSLGFQNNDPLVFCPVIAVNVTTGTFSNGDYITDPLTGANVQIISVDANTLANTTGQVLLKYKPRTDDLANVSANSTAWTLSQNAAIINTGNTAGGVVENIYGVSAAGRVRTNGAGKITDAIISSRGGGYTEVPYVSVYSPGNSSGLATLDIEAQNYIAQVYISSGSNTVGMGYAFTVGEGIIYQKGHFVRVDRQTIIVDKYSPTPNAVAVGFTTDEEIIDYRKDSSLLDNVLGTDNETAPGADRLKLTPRLILKEVSEAQQDNDFFSLVEWNEGNPYKYNQVSVYSRIGDEMNRRLYDHAGNFVIDTFQIITQSSDAEHEGPWYRIVVDPGQAYITGKKVQTTRNYILDVRKGTETSIANVGVSLNYGNYIRVKEVGGLFQFSTGDTIKLYTTAKSFLSNTSLVSAGNTTPQGTQIGTARIRSMTLESGTTGEAMAVYRLHLFDIRMNQGKNFRDVRSVYYDGAYKGIADIVLEQDPTTSANIAMVKGTKNNQLVFYSGVESLKNSNNTNYVYRTIDQAAATSNNGTLTKSIAASPDEFFPYGTGGELSDAQLQELYVVPVGNTLIAYANLTGTVNAQASNTLNGDGTSFIADLEVGDWVYVIANALNWAIKRVTSVTNSTSIKVDSAFAFTNNTAQIFRCFPKNVPVPFGTREGLSANVDANGNILTLNYGMTFAGTGTTNTIFAYNVRRTNVTSTAKTANRNKFVKIQLSNNAGNTIGPWCLGVPDIFRLNAVYIGDTVDVDETSQDVTSEFYIDHNQTANFLDLGWLYKNPRSTLELSSSQFLLCEFSYFTSSGAGYYDTVSYTHTANAAQIATLDSTPLANLESAAASLEVPEIYTYKDEYFELLNCLDFRPAVAATATPHEDPASAPLNPVVAFGFGNTADPSNDKKFPLPDSICNSMIEQYLGRIDHVYISGDQGHIFALNGQAHADPRKRFEPNHPKDCLMLNSIVVPPYPNIPMLQSDTLTGILYNGIANEKVLNLRIKNRSVKPYLSTRDMQKSQPMGYTMLAIGNLDRRISDLEYYVSLSFLETSVTNKIIPSSLDQTLNRFKFGFIADDFTTDLYRDVANPQYAASLEIYGDYEYGANWQMFTNEIANNDTTSPITKSISSPNAITKKKTYRVVPPKYQWMRQHYVDNLPYIDFPIARQPNATETATECESGSFIDVTDGDGVGYYFTVQTSAYDGETREDFLVFGANAGTAELWFYNYHGADKVDIYQSLLPDRNYSLLVSSNATANVVTALTTADKQFLSTNTIANSFYTSATGQIGGSGINNLVNLEQTFTRNGSFTDYVNGAGKITFNHNPNNGRFYKIVIDKGPNSLLWRYLIKYPTAGDLGEVIIDPCKPPPVTIYNGQMKNDPSKWIEVQQYWYWSCAWAFRTVNTAVAVDSLKIWCWGLKPNTKHTFYVDGIDMGQYCIPKGKAKGSDIVTDASGQCLFEYLQPQTTKTTTQTTRLVEDAIKKALAPFMNQREVQDFGSTGYSLFECRASFSSAKMLMGLRNPNSFFPVT